MTTIEKEKIRYLRGEGLGYKAIASRLDLTVDTVKSYCKRSGLNGVAAENADNTCRQCGAVLEHTPGVKKRRFCSDQCGRTWWNCHAFLREPNEKYQCVCGFCGRVFHNQIKGRKYCGHPCYIKARYGEVCAYDKGTV